VYRRPATGAQALAHGSQELDRFTVIPSSFGPIHRDTLFNLHDRDLPDSIDKRCL
jgi:hypothetical protein